MSKKRKKQEEEGRYAYEGLDRIMHEKARLSILTSLASHLEGLLFGDLKEMCSLTDGNLSRHLQMLQEAGLVEVWKRFMDRRPQTLCRISEEGKKRFVEYLEELEQVLQDAREVQNTNTEQDPAKKRALREGWTPA